MRVFIDLDFGGRLGGSGLWVGREAAGSGKESEVEETWVVVVGRLAKLFGWGGEKGRVGSQGKR